MKTYLGLLKGVTHIIENIFKDIKKDDKNKWDITLSKLHIAFRCDIYGRSYVVPFLIEKDVYVYFHNNMFQSFKALFIIPQKTFKGRIKFIVILVTVSSLGHCVLKFCNYSYYYWESVNIHITFSRHIETKHHDFPVPDFENGNGNFIFFLSNFGTGREILVFSSQI